MKDYIFNIQFIEELSVPERWMLLIAYTIAQENKINISVKTYMRWSGYSEKTIKQLRKSLQDKDFFKVIKISKNNKKTYAVSEERILEALTKVSLKNDKIKEKPVDNFEEVQGKIYPTDEDERGKNYTTGGVKFTPHNNINNNNIILLNNNKRENDSDVPSKSSSVAFKKRGSQAEFNENQDLWLTDKLLEMRNNNQIHAHIFYNSISDLVAEISFYIDYRVEGRTAMHAANIALKLIREGAWSVPRALQIKRKELSLEYEQKAAEEKKIQTKEEVARYYDFFEEDENDIAPIRRIENSYQTTEDIIAMIERENRKNRKAIVPLKFKGSEFIFHARGLYFEFEEDVDTGQQGNYNG